MESTRTGTVVESTRTGTVASNSVWSVLVHFLLYIKGGVAYSSSVRHRLHSQARLVVYVNHSSAKVAKLQLLVSWNRINLLICYTGTVAPSNICVSVLFQFPGNNAAAGFTRQRLDANLNCQVSCGKLESMLLIRRAAPGVASNMKYYGSVLDHILLYIEGSGIFLSSV